MSTTLDLRLPGNRRHVCDRSAHRARRQDLSHVESLERRRLMSAVSFDPAADWSPTDNPNGVWTYGWSHSLGTTFNLSSELGGHSGITGHTADIAGTGAPVVSHNDTGGTVRIGTVVWPPDGIILHPGPGGEVSILRFTAPSDGTFAVSSSFTSQDVAGATTDVHVLHNGASVFDGNISSEKFAKFSESFVGAAGDTIDIAVGFGNGSFSNDSTGLDATITMTPSEHGCDIPALMERVAALVEHNVLSEGQSNALGATLRAALSKLDQGKVPTTVNQLEAFVNQVQARIHALDADAATYESDLGGLDDLLGCANEIIEELNAG
jgi:hypothetical protein